MTLRTRSAALLLAAPLALAGCSGQDAAQSGSTASNSAAATSSTSGPDILAAQPGSEVDKTAFTQQTQQAMMGKKTYHMAMTMNAAGQAITMDGQGDMTDPKTPKIKMTMKAPGQQGGSINLVMDGQYMYMQIPGQAGGKYVKVSLAELSKQGGMDFQKMMNPAENLKQSQEALDKVVYQGEEDVSGTKLKHYVMTIDPAKAAKATGQTNMPVPTASNGKATMLTYDVYLDGEKLMRRMKTDVSGSKIDMNIDQYGQPVSISAPPADQTTAMPTPAGAAPSSAPARS